MAGPGRGRLCPHGDTEKHVIGIFSKLELTATSSDHRRVLAVRAYLSAQ